MKDLKELLIDEIYNYKENKHRNSMGCSENWYEKEYAVRETFTKKQLSMMSIKGIQNLLKLAENISDGLY